jgi:hypothetical protein
MKVKIKEPRKGFFCGVIYEAEYYKGSYIVDNGIKKSWFNTNKIEVVER